MTASGPDDHVVPLLAGRAMRWSSRRVLQVLWHRGATILGVVFVTITAAIVMLNLVAPSFVGRSLVIVEPRPAMPRTIEPNTVVLPSNLGLVESEIEIARSAQVLQRVVVREGLTADPEFGALDPNVGDVVSRTVGALSNAVSVLRVGISHVIAIEVRSHDPEKAALLANAVAEEYLEEQRQRQAELLAATDRGNDGDLVSVTMAFRALISDIGDFLDENIDLFGGEDLVALAQFARDAADDAIPGLVSALLGLLRARIANIVLPPGAMTAFVELEQRAVGLRVEHELSVQELTDTDAAAFAPQSRIVSQALVPTVPASPRKALILVVAVAISLVLAGAVALLRERAGGFRDEETAEEIVGVPTLAVTPRLAGSDLTKQAREVVDGPQSTFAEAIRRVRVHFTGSGGGEVVLVTSALPGEGKTLIAASIARAAAQSGRKVLLVDGNLRAPALRDALGSTTRDATHALMVHDEFDAEQLMRTGSQDTLTGLRLVCPMEQTGKTLDRLLESGFLEQLITTAKSNYDLVVLDAPCVLAFPDALLLLRHATKAVLVIRWNATRKAAVIAAFNDLLGFNTGTAELATLLNGRGSARRT